MNELVAWCAGHGEDTYPKTGSKGVPSMAEHTFNAAVVGYAVPLAEHNGFRSLVVQPLNGNDVSLRDRIAKANNTKADFYYSVHADANANQDAWGYWGFYWYKSVESPKFAKIWQKHADNILPNRNPARRIQPSTAGTWSEFAVCRDTNMPAFLGEHGFMTNVGDLALLKNEDFRKACAEVAVRSLCEYFGREFKPMKKSEPAPPKAKGLVLVQDRYANTDLLSVRLPKGSFRMQVVHEKNARVSQLVKKYKADFGINFPFFYAGEPLGDAYDTDSVISSAYGKMLKWHEFAVTEDGTPLIGQLKFDAAKHAGMVQGAPLLNENGKACYKHYIDVQEVQDDIANSRAQRTVISVTKEGDLFITASEGRTSADIGWTMKDASTYHLQKGAAFTLNGDGGGSTVLATQAGKHTKTAERTVHHALLFFLVEPEPEKETEMKTVLTVEDANKLINLLKAVYVIMPDKEIGRLADELRKASGQPTQN